MMKHNNSMVVKFGVPWSLGFVLGLPPGGGFENGPSDHEA